MSDSSACRKRSQKVNNFVPSHIKALVESVACEARISSNANMELRDVLEVLGKKLCCQATELTRARKMTTVKGERISEAAGMLIPGKLGAKCAKVSAKSSLSARSERLARKHCGGLRVAALVPVVLGAVLECVAKAVLKAAHDASGKKKTISVRDLFLGISGHSELSTLICDRLSVELLGGGSEPVKGGHGKRKTGASRREVTHFSKQGDCLYLQKAPFKQAMKEQTGDMRLGKDARMVLQAHLEHKLISLLKGANDIAATRNQSTVKVEDVRVAHKLAGGSC